MKKDPNAIEEPKFAIREVKDEEMLTDIAGGWTGCEGHPGGGDGSPDDN